MADEVIFATSGSTGPAKSIVRTEASLCADAAALVTTFPEIWAGSPAVVTTIPSDHLFGALWRMRAPRAAGSTVEPRTALSVEDLLAARARYGRYLLVTTPSFLEKVLETNDLDALHGTFVGIVTAGSLLRAETARACAVRFGVAPLEIFGATEVGTVAWRRQESDARWTLVPGVEATRDDAGRLVVDSPYAMARPWTLSDAVELTDARHFNLLGRTDRTVKVLETLVALPTVEAALESHPWVAAARVEAVGASVPRLGALVVLTREGAEALAQTTQAEIVAVLRRALLTRLGGSFFPRRVRFVRTLPTDARGKTTAVLARAALGAWCREPAVLDWTVAGETLSARLVFTPDCECFSGHFPGVPVLPGVVQLYFVRHFARQAFDDFPETLKLRRLKFQKLVFPGRELRLNMTRRGPGAFAFSLALESGLASSGLLEGGAA